MYAPVRMQSRPSRPCRTILTLGELEPLPCLWTAGLFPLYLARIAGQHALLAHRRAEFFVVHNQSTSKPHPHSIGLTRKSTTVDANDDIERSVELSHFEWLLNADLMGRTGEVVLHCTTVDTPITLTRAKEDAGDRTLSSTYGLDLVFTGHSSNFLSQMSRGSGRWP